jgi:hypothetical protein
MSSDGNIVAIGAIGNDGNGTGDYSGHVRVYEINSPCSIPGCPDSTASNYNPLATIDDGSCIPFIYGCTDITACTYDILSNTDDGSCLYLDIFGICGGNNTIQMAIDSASPGDIINIPLGTYTEFLVINKSIALNAQSGVLLNVAGHSTGILIDDSTSDVTINSLTITGDNLTGSPS